MPFDIVITRMMTLTKIQIAQNGDWNLPSVRDLLDGVEPERAPPMRPQPPVLLSPSFKGNIEKCFQSSNGSTYSTRYTDIPLQDTNRHPLPPPGFRNNPGANAFPRRASDRGYFQPDVSYITRANGSDCHKSQHALKASSLPAERCRLIPPLNRSQSLGGVPKGPTLRDRTISNDRHKLSEKHRRDGMGVYVQVADIFRDSLRPAMLSGCRICTHDNGHDENLATPPMQYESGTSTGWSKSKKTKSDMLEDTMMWLFSIVLHMWPQEMGSRMDEIRIFAKQLTHEREFGLQNDFAKSNKWHADVRADLLKQVLMDMEVECERHGVLASGRGSPSNMDYETTGSVFTLPNSSTRTSPTCGQKRPREVGAEEFERRVR